VRNRAPARDPALACPPRVDAGVTLKSSRGPLDRLAMLLEGPRRDVRHQRPLPWEKVGHWAQAAQFAALVAPYFHPKHCRVLLMRAWPLRRSDKLAVAMLAAPWLPASVVLRWPDQRSPRRLRTRNRRLADPEKFVHIRWNLGSTRRRKPQPPNRSATVLV
jgi:hypothetical protein